MSVTMRLWVSCIVSSGSQLLLFSAAMEMSRSLLHSVLIAQNLCPRVVLIMSDGTIWNQSCVLRALRRVKVLSIRECQNRLKAFPLCSSLSFSTVSPITSLPLCLSNTLPPYLLCSLVRLSPFICPPLLHDFPWFPLLPPYTPASRYEA